MKIPIKFSVEFWEVKYIEYFCLNTFSTQIQEDTYCYFNMISNILIYYYRNR